jgi:hypothetical protein
MTHLTARVRQKNKFFLPDIFRIFPYFSRFRPIFSLRLGKSPHGRPKNLLEQIKSILVKIKKKPRFREFDLSGAPFIAHGDTISTCPDSENFGTINRGGGNRTKVPLNPNPNPNPNPNSSVGRGRWVNGTFLCVYAFAFCF